MKLNKRGQTFVKVLQVLLFTIILVWGMIEFGHVELRSRDGEEVYTKVSIKNTIHRNTNEFAMK